MLDHGSMASSCAAVLSNALPIPAPWGNPRPHSPSLLTKSPILVPCRNNSLRGRGRGLLLVVFAEGNGEPSEDEARNGADELNRERRPGFNLRWRDLLDPDPENILAIGLTGLLTWASLQALFQIFLISLAILVAALKYSFIAALLLFILVTLL